MKSTLLVVGVLVMSVGLLWLGQGLGVVRWPTWSAMIDQTKWAYYGAALALAGLGTIWLARR